MVGGQFDGSFSDQFTLAAQDTVLFASAQRSLGTRPLSPRFADSVQSKVRFVQARGVPERLGSVVFGWIVNEIPRAAVGRIA